MKRWPRGNKPVDFDELTDPLRKAILFGYKLERKNEDKDVPWRGLNIGQKEMGILPPPDVRFKAKYLALREEGQGEDLLDTVLAIGVQLGIEQGRRVAYKELEEKRTLEDLKKRVEKRLKRVLKKRK